MKTTRRSALLGGAALALPRPADAALGWAAFQDSALAGTPNWQTLKIGGGGNFTQMDIAPDGTMVASGDIFGAYVWDNSLNRWRQLFTVGTGGSLPSQFVTGFYVGGSGAGSFVGAGYGSGNLACNALRIAPANTQIFWAHISFTTNLGPRLLKTTNQGNSWTALTGYTDTATPAGGVGIQQRITFHPSDSVDATMRVWVGSATAFQRTTDGGNNWIDCTLHGFTAPSGNSGVSGICFDPASLTTVYAFSGGVGLFKSTDGGQTWAAMATSGGPGFVQNARVFAGDYYCCGATGATDWRNTTTVYKYSSSGNTWSTIISGNYTSIIFDPNNTNHAIVTDNAGNSMDGTLSGGVWSWSGGSVGNYINKIQVGTNDVRYLPSSCGSNAGHPGFCNYQGSNTTLFDPIVANKVWSAGGFGIFNADWTATLAANFTTWITQSRGLEEFEVDVMVCPSGGAPVAAGWDLSLFTLDPTNTLSPVKNNASPIAPIIIRGYDIDFAKQATGTQANPNQFLAALVQWSQNGQEASQYSTDGGNTWNLFANAPPIGNGQSIACLTDQNIVCLTGNPFAVYYTTNRAATAWINSMSFGGSGGGPGYWAKLLCAVGGVGFYFATGSQILSSPTGASWTTVSNTPLIGGNPLSTYWRFPQFLNAPGTTTDFIIVMGPQTTAQPDGLLLYLSTNTCASFAPFANVQSVWCAGYGAPASPGGYPGLWINGWVKVGTNPYKYGIWRSYNSNQATPTWEFMIDWPAGCPDQITSVCPHPTDPTICYLGTEAFGVLIGTFLV